jgi:3-oxoacyl-(acyl-carrier-protein) synthase
MLSPYAVSPIAITGMGMVLPTGSSMDDLWRHWLEELSALKPYRNASVSTSQVAFFGSVSAEDHAKASACVPRKLRRYASPSSLLGAMAAGQALREAGVDMEACDAHRYGLYTAQGDYTSPAFHSFERAFKGSGSAETQADGDPNLALQAIAQTALHARGLAPMTATKGMANNLLALLSLTHRFQGEGGAFVQNESATGAALEAAMFALRQGHCELALVVAAGSYDDALPMAEQARGGRLSACKFESRSLRSFDLSRDGTVLAEGAVALVLEAPARVRRRGGRSLAYLSGVGCHASGLCQVPPDGAYTGAFERALSQTPEAGSPRSSGVDVALVDGRGTLEHDGHEIRFLRHLAATLGPRAVPLTTARPVTGLVPAAGALMDIALAARILQTGRIPAVAGLQEPEAQDLAWVRGRPLQKPVGRVLALQSSFGGYQSAVLVDHPLRHE